MNRIRIYPLLILLLLLSSTLHSQRKRNFGIQFSAGANYYFNNMEVFSDYIKPVNYSLYTKWMWNTRYRLSFGIETGYIQLYRMGDIPNFPAASSVVHMIPVHAAIHMRIKGNWYVAGTFGPSFIQNLQTSEKGEQMTHSFSTADISIAVGYKHTFQNNFFIGAEAKYFYSSKYEDRNLAFPVLVGFHF